MDATTHISKDGRRAACGKDTNNPYRRDAWSGSRPVSGARRRRFPRARAVTLVAATAFAAFLLMAAFEMAGIYAEAFGGTEGDAGALAPAAPAEPVSGDGAQAASTPRSQWHAGEVPFLYQVDPAYSSAPYAGSDVETAGCGPTCLSMVYIALTGKTDRDPEAMAAFSESEGYVESGMTAWRLMSDGAAQLGLASRELPADSGVLRSELEAGHPVICSVRPGDFTTKGHFIVLAGVTDDGQLVVHDPNSPANSAKTWDVQRVLDQCANLWAFERA